MAGILLLAPHRDRASDIRSILKSDGHDVIWHREIESWRQREADTRPDVIIAPVDDAETLVAMASRKHRRFAAPLLLIQQESGISREPFAEDRLMDRMTSPFLSEELLGRVDALARVQRVIRGRSIDDDTGNAGRKGGPGQWLAALFGARHSSIEKPQAPYLEVAVRVADWADRRDAFELGHAERVTSCCAAISDELGLERDEAAALLRAAALHDIGKVALPSEMLHQAGPLRENQLRLMRTHPKRGAVLLNALDPNPAVAATVRYHHECPDGSGYYGLSPERTPRTAKVLAVAEIFDAMTHCTLRDKLTEQEALERLQSERGKKVDADCVDALASVISRRRSAIPVRTRQGLS